MCKLKLFEFLFKLHVMPTDSACPACVQDMFCEHLGRIPGAVVRRTVVPSAGIDVMVGLHSTCEGRLPPQNGNLNICTRYRSDSVYLWFGKLWSLSDSAMTERLCELNVRCTLGVLGGKE